MRETTLGALLESVRRRLAAAGVPSPVADAEQLLEHVSGLNRAELVLERGRELGPAQSKTLEELVRRREGREPLQWILGRAHFYGLALEVESGVLIPRPETERLVELALLELPDGGTVVDVGTGTGAVALALKSERPAIRVLATDLNPRAARLAARNAAALGLEIEVRQGSLFAGLAGPFDAVVSNPPYLPESEARLEPEVLLEPPEALFAGKDGLAVARDLVGEAARALKPGGLMALELDPRNVRVLAAKLGRDWEDVRVETDLTGRERFLLTRRV